MAEIIVFILAIIGFYVSWHIFKTKKQNSSLVCHFGEDCNGVVNSKYNTTFGFKNELLGMFYYLFAAFFSALLLLGINIILTIPVKWPLLISGIIAALFSLYFVYLQAFVLKKWCEYCITSAIITFLILAAELFLL